MCVCLKFDLNYVSLLFVHFSETTVLWQVKKRVMKFQSSEQLFWEAHGVLLDPVRLEKNKYRVPMFNKGD